MTAKSNAREGDGVADLSARLERTALDLVEHRQTHVVWRDWLQANLANEAVNPHAGSAEFHAGVILDYDRHLSNIREAIAALQAQQGAEPVAWQPIASAPLDGTRVLTFAPRRTEFTYHVTTNRFKDGAWQHCNSACPPTHWQPLPGAPR